MQVTGATVDSCFVHVRAHQHGIFSARRASSEIAFKDEQTVELSSGGLRFLPF